MSGAAIESASPGRLATLLSFLESDAENPALLSDAADAAIGEGEPETALMLLDRHAAIQPLSLAQINLVGLAAMRTKNFALAASRFQSLLHAGVDDTAVRFNLAWSLAMLKNFPAATSMLDETVTTQLPQAAMLRVQLLHDQGLIDEAEASARAAIEIHPDHEGVMAAVSVLALDIEDEAMARACANRAADHPDALSTLGMLELGDDHPTEAREMFDRAIALNDVTPRAWIGRGLAKLLTGDSTTAANDIDRGAEMFGNHLGSWIAAGWTHVINKDFAAGRARFNIALALDDNFAETHGSLAVLDVLQGNIPDAEMRCETARRLDPGCYSGALAKALLAAHSGDEGDARRIFELAVNTPVDGGGRTIAQALARLGR